MLRQVRGNRCSGVTAATFCGCSSLTEMVDEARLVTEDADEVVRWIVVEDVGGGGAGTDDDAVVLRSSLSSPPEVLVVDLLFVAEPELLLSMTETGGSFFG